MTQQKTTAMILDNFRYKNTTVKIRRIILVAIFSILSPFARAEKNTSLIDAVNMQDLPMFRRLIDQGANVNQAETDGTTPLYMALQFGHTDIVAILVGAPGIQINQQNNAGTTALGLASQLGQTETVRLLLQQPKFIINYY